MSRLTSRPRLLLAVVVGLAALLVVETIVLAATTKRGGPVKAVKVVTESAATSVESGSWTDLAGMSLSMTVPSGEKGLMLITFSSSSSCQDISGATGLCHIRVLVDGTEALPGMVIYDGAPDSNAPNALETNSMQFVAGPLAAGAHTIKVQAVVGEEATFFDFYDRTLSVLRSKV